MISQRTDLRVNIKTTKIIASGPIIAWQIEGEKVEEVTDPSSWAPKSLWTMTAATESEDDCFLAGNR